MITGILLFVAGCFGAAPAPWANATVAWILVGIAGFLLLVPVLGVH